MPWFLLVWLVPKFEFGTGSAAGSAGQGGAGSPAHEAPNARGTKGTNLPLL